MSDALTELRMQVIWTRLISIVEEQAQTLMRTAFSTSAAFDGASTPRSRYTVSSIPVRTWPPSRKACASIGNAMRPMPNAVHGAPRGRREAKYIIVCGSAIAP